MPGPLSIDQCPHLTNLFMLAQWLEHENDNRKIGKSQVRNLGKFVYPGYRLPHIAFPLVRSILVSLPGEKKTHTGGKHVTCSGLAIYLIKEGQILK